MTSDNLPAAAGGRRAAVHYSLRVVRAFLARVASGESQASIFRDPAMPGRGGVEHWVKTRPRFAQRLRHARAVSGHLGKGGSPSTYCPVTAHEIFRRVCEGESVTAICRDPAMPCFSTVYLWRRTFPDFAEAMRVAREVQAERLCDEGWEMAQAATPGTAIVTSVRLAQLRWMMGHMAPRAWGKLKAVEPDIEPLEDSEGAQQVTFVVKHYKIEEREDGSHRVVAFVPDEATGAMVRATPEDAPWHPPPAGRWRDSSFGSSAAPAATEA